MNIKLLIVFLAFLTSCAQLKYDNSKSKLKKEGYYLVLTCTIYNLDGDLVRSYPGEQCLFLKDGSYLSYNSATKTLTKIGPMLNKIWSRKIHLHHQMRETEEGHYLVNSSVVKEFQGIKKVRFDEVLLLGKDGETKKRFSFYDYYKNQDLSVKFSPYPSQWEQNLNFSHEFTHLAASYEVTKSIRNDNEIFAPRGSFLLTLNSNDYGVFVLDNDMKNILNIRKVSNKVFHDLQRFSSTEVIFFSNNATTKPLNPEEEASVVIYDVFKNKVTSKFRAGFYSLFNGGVQVLRKDLILVSDSNSKFGASLEGRVSSSDINDRTQLNIDKKERVVFFSPDKGILDEIHFKLKYHHAKLFNLKSFLDRNIGI